VERRRKRVISGAVVLGVLAAGFLVARLQQVPARAATADRAVPATITIDPQIGETFALAPSSATPRLTAQQAWQRYAEQAHSSRATIPSFVTARLGLYTLPVGPVGPGTGHLVQRNGEAYTALNQLVYGFSSPSGCVSTDPYVTFPPDAHCIEWTFLNANTGKMIDSTWQKIGHWHVLVKRTKIQARETMSDAGPRAA